MRKLILCFVLSLTTGNTVLAQNPSIDSLLRIINRPQEDSGKVKAYHVLAALTVGTDAVKAIEYSKKGIEIGKRVGYARGLANCYLNVSYCYSILNNLREGVTYLDSAIVWYKKLGNLPTLALSYQNRADYNMRLGRLRQSLIDCDTSLVYSERANRPNGKKYVYKILGSIYFMQKDYGQSQTYYEKAYEQFEKIPDSITMADILNKLGNVYEEKKDYNESIRNFEKAIQIGTAIKQENNLSEYYSNLSNVWLKKGDKKKAEASALKAVEYAKAKKNKLQLAKAQNMLSTIYLKTDSTAAAIQSATEGFSIATGIAATDAQQNSADALAEGYFKKGDYKNAYHYLQISKSLNDSLAKAKYDKDIVEVQTKFKVNEKDNEILLLGKDKELQQQVVQKQRLLMLGAGILVILALIAIWLLMNRNKLRNQMKELELRNQIAADLHDEVGSSLSSIHMLSQMVTTKPETSEKEKNILQKMSTNAKETMDKMGDIVWMIKPGETESESLKQRMERFAYEIAESKNIDTAIHLEELENCKLTMDQRKNIYLVFKEAVNNAVKYSGTEKIDIKADVENKHLLLTIKDEGKGFDTSIAGNGNGLTNMQKRAKGLNGQLTMSSKINEGTTIELSVPV